MDTPLLSAALPGRLETDRLVLEKPGSDAKDYHRARRFHHTGAPMIGYRFRRLEAT